MVRPIENTHTKKFFNSLTLKGENGGSENTCCITKKSCLNVYYPTKKFCVTLILPLIDKKKNLPFSFLFFP